MLISYLCLGAIGIGYVCLERWVKPEKGWVKPFRLTVILGGLSVLGLIIAAFQQEENKPQLPKPSTAEEVRESQRIRATILERDLASFSKHMGEIAGTGTICFEDSKVKELTQRVRNAFIAFKPEQKQIELAVSTYNIPLQMGDFMRRTQKLDMSKCHDHKLVLQGTLDDLKNAGF